MSPLDPEVPPAGEEIHLPGPSLIPLLNAVGLTLSIVGITTFIEFTIVGVILFLVTLVIWIRDVRRDFNELPLEHSHH